MNPIKDIEDRKLLISYPYGKLRKCVVTVLLLTLTPLTWAGLNRRNLYTLRFTERLMIFLSHSLPTKITIFYLRIFCPGIHRRARLVETEILLRT